MTRAAIATRRRRVAIVSITVLAGLGALCGAAFIPKVANHFGYALPGEKGLPYQIQYNGRDYRNTLTCAGARWCEDEKTPEQRTKPYCTPRAGLGLGDGGTGLVKVDDVFTLFGPSRPVFTAGVVAQGKMTAGVVVEVSDDCYLEYTLVGGP
ncbi:hypothetical protein GCM10027598_35590 [Amycolatopsis oliviviridis]|uniref:Uncharacterized protein n=1 Tax=Amycolatopsis oliviviridis TaxID=1471590 RepID=A0ABQ3LF15_9PSEU|nr:hypothetical protein [Amycolatopsis oliviviridis]GHH13460.1 hypothetical protein GCM10017790_26240 [Amycolatopsis oliviviridis]